MCCYYIFYELLLYDKIWQHLIDVLAGHTIIEQEISYLKPAKIKPIKSEHGIMNLNVPNFAYPF